MNLFNSVKTRRVSRKNHSPQTFILKTSSDGLLVRVELENQPIPSTSDDFSIENMQKTGVKFDAPQGPFINPSPLQASDNILIASSQIANVPTPSPEPTPTPESITTSEPTPQS